jgi:hypothetical protein
MEGSCSICGDRYETVDAYWRHGFQHHSPDDFVRKGRSSATRSALIGAVATLIVGGAAAFLAYAANRYADEANGFAAATNERLDWEQTHQHASKIYLGEAPQYFYREFDRDEDLITWVVLNASGIEVNNVWIEGKNDKWIGIQGIQRCTMYSAPLYTEDGTEFVPVAVHFSDPISVDGHFIWRRTTTGELHKTGMSIADRREMDPDGRDDGNPGPVMDVRDCSG